MIPGEGLGKIAEMRGRTGKKQVFCFLTPLFGHVKKVREEKKE